MDIKKKLDEEIERLLSHIASLGYGTDERKAAISELDRLYKLRLEETKNEQDYKKDCERQAMEKEFHKADEALKRDQMAQELKLHEDDKALKKAEETLKRDQMAADAKLHKADEALKRDQMKADVELHKAEEALKRDQMAMEREFHQADDQSKRDLLSDQAIERYLKYGAVALEVILPIVAYGVWYKKGLKFEETGTVTSTMTRNLISKMLPKKK